MLCRPRTAELIAANIAGGTHADGCLTKAADAVHTERYSLVKVGSDSDHIAVNGAGEKPLGVCTDAPDVAEYNANVQLLGCAPGTVPMVAGDAVAVDDELYPMASGRVGNAATVGAGATYRVGRALSAASAAGEEIEVEPEKPTAETLS